MTNFSKYYEKLNKAERLNGFDRAYVFDFDNTLFVSVAMVKIYDRKTGKLKNKLTPEAFIAYSGGGDEMFGFDEFNDPKLVMSAKPLKNNAAFRRLVQIDSDIRDGRLKNSKIYILTARDNQVKAAIYELLVNHGISTVNPHQIMTIGREIRNSNKSTAYKKREVVIKLKALHFGSIEFFDDDENNINMVKDIIGVKAVKI